MSMIQTSIEHLPLVAGAAGMAVGTAMDLMAQRTIEANRQAFTEQAGLIAEIHQPSRLQKIGRAVTSPIVAVAVPVAAFAGLAWQPEAPIKTESPVVEVVVDASAATAVLHGGEPARQVNAFVEAIDDNDGTSAEALIARGGTVSIGSPEDVSSVQPFGDAVLEQAMQTALDEAQQVRNESIEAEAQQNVGIVVLTNGNTVGSAEAIIPRAQATKTPVYVVNVEQGEGDQAVIQNLQTITAETGGQYWEATSTEPQAVAQQVEDSLKAIEVPVKNQEQSKSWPVRALSVAMAGLIPYMYNRRRNMPTTFNGLS